MTAQQFVDLGLNDLQSFTVLRLFGNQELSVEEWNDLCIKQQVYDDFEIPVPITELINLPTTDKTDDKPDSKTDKKTTK